MTTSSRRVLPLEEDFPFDIISHTIPVMPFREYPHAIIDESKGVSFAVNQYIPRTTNPKSSSVTVPITIIAAGGLGAVKEMYEPLFADVLAAAQSRGVAIRAIWMADLFNVGEGYLANRDNLGCDATWLDHSRDLWSMVSHFRHEMIKPIVALGHSFACNQFICLSNWHPTLFHSLAFIEPGIDLKYGKGTTIPWALEMVEQRSSWSTRAEAESHLIKSKDGEEWDERVIARVKHYGIANPTTPGGQWTYLAPGDQIAAMISRCNHENIGFGPNGLKSVTLAQRELIPDSDPEAFHPGSFYRRELRLAWDMLPNVRPWVLYINGTDSPYFGDPQTRDERLRLTGTGVGGNGGVELGAVRQIIIENGKHSMALDKTVTEAAGHVADWLESEVRRWVEGPQSRRDAWLAKSMKEKQSVSKEFKAALVAEVKRIQRVSKL